MSRDQNRLSKVHFERNRYTRGDWESFAPHRQRVTELILAAAPRFDRPSICILGAGNGNDFDLSMLAERDAKITLVDLDRDALDHCLAQQSEDVAARVEVVGGIDLSGLLASLDSVDVDDPAQIDPLIQRVSQSQKIEGLASFDVVVSTCLLTQIIDSLVTAIGPDHPRFVDLVLALRDGHLRLLCELTNPGGTALLITDFVSSDTVPQLPEVSDEELESLLARAINDRNFFTGVNPAVLAQQFATKSIGQGGEVECYRPWRWPMGDRMYAVCAVALKK